MKILCLIPARSGSKSLVDKNIKLLNNKPLLSYSINQAKNSKHNMRIIVSTDSRKYADIAIDMAELNSNARHVIINNSSHNTHLENTPVFISEVKNHLARIDR